MSYVILWRILVTGEKIRNYQLRRVELALAVL